MNKTRLAVPALIVAAAVSITGSVLSQDRQDPPADRQMEAMRAMLPGEAHARLARYVGEYDVASRFVVPNMDPVESTGTAKVTSALDGRFIVVETESTMMGRPYTSVQWYGHNNFSKRYEAVWMYTMGTSMMRLDGDSTDDGATVKWTATYHGADGKETLDILTRFDETDRFVIEMGNEGEGPVMTTTYTRKK